ncbi:MAG: hypothetical protein B7Y45_09400 [Sphingomonas sp. 28-66-16]|nr:MAG: hypothetical protein B7Y45_09400 [Sphingomonas sp. 28-66-16]
MRILATITVVTLPLLSGVATFGSDRAGAQTPAVPPPIVSSRPGVPGQRMMIAWRPGPVTCDGGPIATVAPPAPEPSLGWASNALITPQRFTFGIDARGRPLGIARAVGGQAIYSGDLAPSLAAALFAPGAARTGCSVSFVATAMPLDAAPIDMLIAYSLAPQNGQLPRAAFERILPAGTTCINPPPALRSRAYPDFKALPHPAGRRDWSMTGYDIDRQGRPVRIRIVASTGNAALDRASIVAVSKSRFEPGERTGCRYPYWVAAAPLPAPPLPDSPGQPDQGNCADEASWQVKPVLAYPDAYRRRGIEGWARIAYDVAPWGAIGNLRVIASEPSADFGAAALQTIRGATKAPSLQGRSNCVTRVRFVMAASDHRNPSAPSEEGPPPF